MNEQSKVVCTLCQTESKYYELLPAKRACAANQTEVGGKIREDAKRKIWSTKLCKSLFPKSCFYQGDDVCASAQQLVSCWVREECGDHVVRCETKTDKANQTKPC